MIRMNILQLPEEILIIICKNLGLQELYNLYYTCIKLKNIVCVFGLRTLDLSLSNFSYGKFLMSAFLRDTNNYIENLNLCALQDLTKSNLLPFVKKLKNLKSLNVSFTKISIIDLLDVYSLCPSLKSVSVNFDFGTKPKLSEATLLACQDVFANFENVEFVGSGSNLLWCTLPLHVLKKCMKLNVAKFTIITGDFVNYMNVDHEVMFKFNNIIISVINWKQKSICYGSLSHMTLTSLLEKSSLEFVIISFTYVRYSFKVYASRLFKDFFWNHFSIEVEPNLPLDVAIIENTILLFWDAKSNVFDDKFFKKLLIQMNDIIPCKYHYPEQTDSKKVLNNRVNWIVTDFSSQSANIEPYFKKKRIAPATNFLNFDELLKGQTNLNITVQFENTLCPIGLSSQHLYLKEVTYMSLKDIPIFDKNFFLILFNCCLKLKTLNVEPAPTAKPILLLKSVEFCRSLVNFRYVERGIDFNILFSILSKCTWIENVHVWDKSSLLTDFFDPSIIIEKCCNLYSLFIQVSMSDSLRKKVMKHLNTAKKKFARPYLNLELYSGCGYMGKSYDPFIDVFNLYTIKRL